MKSERRTMSFAARDLTLDRLVDGMSDADVDALVLEMYEIEQALEVVAAEALR